jgi:hypothetical protein
MQIKLLDIVVLGSKPSANLFYEMYSEILQLTQNLFCLCFDGRAVLIVTPLYGGGWLSRYNFGDGCCRAEGISAVDRPLDQNL